ncbi:PilC/PilY family type IV pilus protein [Microbulbifer sp. 2201CG32-9]|uniref:PilC/PilY family type IV pilus protein n=1 Tax=Microbulbifer sp. 2201CG32-9 TaxID=3232309 RepID=UPI00345B596B
MVNQRQNNFSIQSLLWGLCGFLFAFSTCVSAAPLTLSEVPLQATGKVEPNLIILMDSSGSMGRTLSSGETRLAVAKTAATELVNGLGEMRVGLAQFYGSNGALMLQGLTSVSTTGARTDLVSQINGISAGGNTPLAEAMADLGRYYVEGYPEEEVTIHPGGGDAEQDVEAREVLGAGPIMNGVSSPGTGQDAAIQQYCQKNFILALTDGLPTSDSPRSSYLRNYDGDDNNQNNEALDDVAKALYDIDWRPDLIAPEEPEHKNNITSYFIGFADANLADNPLLESAGSQGGGSYQYADSADALAAALNDAVNAISNSIGTQASVAFNSTSLDVGSVIYSAQFDTADSSGKLFARSLNPQTGRIATTLWEASKKLTEKSASTREIITYFNGVGVPFDATTSGVDGNPEDSPHEQDLNFNDSTNSADGLWAQRLAYLRGNTSNEGSGLRKRGSFSATVDNLIGSKLLGDIVHSTPIYVGRPQLNWPPSFGGNSAAQSYEQFRISNQNRSAIVYVGANDGMLHGFDADSGEEVFAYVPALVLDATRYEGLHSYTHPDYRHNYYVDLTPAVSDIYINTSGNGNQKNWTTVLVGGLRGGGKGYFALNVTDPGKLKEAETNADDIALWEFDGATDANSLGYSYSEAQIAKLNNGKWAAIFGNGYNSETGQAGLFIVYIEEGIDGWSAGEWKFISTGSGADATGRKNGLSSPRLIDLNRDRLVDRVYAGDLMGNMWSFDLSSDSDEDWGVYGDKPLFSAGNAAGRPNRAILAAPLVARNTAVDGQGANVLVMFGTGQYLNSGDLSDNRPGSFYAVWDNGSTQGDDATSIKAGNLAKQVLEIDSVGRKINEEKSVTVNWAVHRGWRMPFLRGDVDVTGFSGERVITAPTLRRNTLFFSTVIPNPLPCASSGAGYLMSVDFRTGAANDDAVADFNGDGEINADDNGYVGVAFTGCIGGSCEDDGGSENDNPGMPGQSGFIGDVRCTPGSSGDVLCDDIDVGDEEREGRLSWEEFSPR